MSDSQSFILTGHSLGGGLASTAYVAAHSLGKNIKTYTFNAAGVSSNALSNYNLSIPVSISDIKAYYLDWDILSYSQYMLSSIPCALGTQIEIDGPYDSSITTEIAIYVLGVLVEDPAICLAGNILAFNTMLAAHGIESLLYGFLATENIFTSNIDAYGYEI